MPVTLLAVAVVAGAVVGLSLDVDSSARSVAQELRCAHIRSTHPQPGVREDTCSYHGHTIVILSLGKGTHSLDAPTVPDDFIVAPEGKAVVIGCQRREDCVTIHRQLGGDLSSGPMLGLSLVVG